MFQGVGAVREDLLVLVRRERSGRVVSEGLRKISRADRSSSWELSHSSNTSLENYIVRYLIFNEVYLPYTIVKC